MAGSFAEARAQILSLQPATLRAKAGEVRRFGSASISAGTTLRASADRLGAQRGAPYQAYRERVSPTAGWLADLGRPTADTGAALEGSAGAAERAQMVLAQQEEALARYAANPSTTAAALAAAEAQALAVLNGAIGEVSSAYAGILPPPPTPAPVVAAGPAAGTSAGAGTGLGGAVGGAATGLAAGLPNGGATGASAGGTVGAARDAGSGAGGTPGSAVGAALGPTSGPFAGFVQDPTTGNLIDPATGRQADASGRFLDPVTGEPFGPASPFVSRLEGLDGGVSPVGGLLGGVPGGLGAAAPGGLAPVVGGAGGAGAFAGGAGFVPGGALPFLGAAGAGVGAAGGRGRGGSGSFAALYGGVVPPSLSGNNPAAAQLRQQAATNLSTMAGTAQRYTAIASGQAAPGAYLPPMAGVGGGAAGGGGAATRRGGRPGPRVAEPSSVWGATGSTGCPDRRRKQSRPSTDVEDDSVWSAGCAAPRSLDAC